MTDISLTSALAAYLPRDRAAQLLTGASLAAEGLAVIADIAGFTPLTETLARELSPARGGEELTRALNSVFAPLIAEVHRFGGSVVKFGGDALIVWFPQGPRGRRTATLGRALTAAMHMQAAIGAHGRVSTPAGPFTLTMKIGMAYGPVLRVRLGDATLGYEDVIGGATLDRMAEAEHHAGPGEIVLDPRGLPEAGELGLVRAERAGYLVLDGPRRPAAAVRPRPAGPPADASALVEQLRPYVPAEVFEALRDGRQQPAELKPVVSLFVQFEGIRYEGGVAAGQLEAYFAAAQATAARYGGRVNRLLTGDKGSLLHLIFGAPRALEELERRAALCALELRLAAGELGFISAQRIGAAAGRVFAGPVGSAARRDYTVMGDAINLSARLMQGAEAGQIVLDGGLAARLADDFALEDLGEARLKGKAEPVARFALLGQAAALQTPRRAARAYGRGLELAAMRRQIDALAAGRGGAAVMIGDLGMGKSHLLAALRASSDVDWAGAAAAGYGQPRSGALIAAGLAELLGLTGAERPAARIEGALAGLLGPRAGAAALPYLSRFLGLPLDEEQTRDLAALAGESLRWRIFELLGELLRAATRRGPLVLALDDLQWADPTSLELLEALVPLADELPLLLILASRPERASRAWPLLERLRVAGALRVELGQLADAAALAVVVRHAPTLTADAQARLAERGQGNPLFLVELARTAAAGGDPAELPDSVQGLLLAQIDRLPGELRETLQLAAVLGPGFAPRLLAALASPGAPLGERLAALEAAGFLLRSGAGYGFRHILIRESAYGALIYERRRGYHDAAAAAIEALFPTQLAERSGELADHYERAERLGRAARYHGQAADGARLLYANAEAEAGYRHVLELLERGEADEGLRARTNLKLAQVKMNEGDYAAAQELYDVAFALLEQEEAQRQHSIERQVPLFRMGSYEPETLDPGRAATAAALTLANELFEGLVTIDSDLNIIPAVARRWQVLDDGTRYRFEIRPGARWSDGAPLQASDFVFAWQRNLDPHQDIPMGAQLYPIVGAQAYKSSSAANPQHIAVRALNQATLEVELVSPIAHFLYLMAAPIAFPLPQHVLRTHGDNWFQPQTFVGNGPFVPTAWSTGQCLDLRRSPMHERRAGDLNYVRIYFGAPGDDSAHQEVLDIVRCEDRPELIEEHTGPVVSIQYFDTYMITFACAYPPFDRPVHRKAFAMAIDRERLVQEVWAGLQPAATGGVVPPGIPGHSPGIGLPFAPVLAKQLLAPWVPTSQPIILGCLPGLGKTPAFLQRSWYDHLGVEVTIRADIPVEELLEDLKLGRIHMAVFGYNLEFPEASDILRTLFYSTSSYNYVGWHSARFDSLIDQSQNERRPIDRFECYHRADSLLCAEEAVVVPLYHSRTFALLRPGFSLTSETNVLRGGYLPLDQVVCK